MLLSVLFLFIYFLDNPLLQFKRPGYTFNLLTSTGSALWNSRFNQPLGKVSKAEARIAYIVSLESLSPVYPAYPFVYIRALI